MNLLPEKLFQLLAKDARTAGPRRFGINIPLTVSGANLVGSWLNDTGQVLLIGGCSSSLTPAAGQKFKRWGASVVDAGANVMARFAAVSIDVTLSTAAAALYVSQTVNGNAMCFPTETISVAVQFDGGANSGDFNLFGILIPRGTLN